MGGVFGDGRRLTEPPTPRRHTASRPKGAFERRLAGPLTTLTGLLPVHCFAALAHVNRLDSVEATPPAALGASRRGSDSGCRDIVPRREHSGLKRRAEKRTDSEIWGNDIVWKTMQEWGNEMRNIVPPLKMRVVSYRKITGKVEAPGVEPGSESAPLQYLRAYPMV